MKKIKTIFSILLLTTIFFSCESDDEKFSGSPVGNMEIVNIKGTVSTDATLALTNQMIDFTVTLPEGKTFADTVQVEVSAITKGGGRTRAYVEIKGGDTSGTGEIRSGGGVIFETTLDLQITAIELYTVEPGKHYTMTSDPVVVRTGNSVIPSVDNDRLQVNLIWEAPSSSPGPTVPGNNVQFFVDKPAGFADVSVLNLSGGKTHTIHKTNGQGGNNVNNSHAEGDYIFSITGINQQTPRDLPYRLIVRYPNGDTDVFEGVYEGLVGGLTPSPLKPVLKVTKTGSGNAAVFTVTDTF